MAASLTNTLDTNAKLATSSALTLTDETVITLYIFKKTGTSKKHETVIQLSPDGTNWMTHPTPIRGEGMVTVTGSAAKIRACVVEDEGATSTVDFHLVAR